MRKKNFKNISQTPKSVTKLQVKQMISANQQNLKKYIDTSTTSTVGSSTNTLNLSLPTTGTGETSMSGNSIDLKEFEINYIAQCATNTAALQWGDNFQARFLLVQGLGAQAPVLSEVLQTTTNYYNLLAPYRYDTLNKSFRVVDDWVTTVDPFNSAHVHQRKVNAKVHNLRYDTVGSEWSTGQPVLFVLVNSNLSSSTFNYLVYIRGWFYDV